MATNRIGFSTDFVLVNNKIGIGTTNPSSTLSVSVGSSSRALDIGTDLLVSGSGAGVAWSRSFLPVAGAGANSFMKEPEPESAPGLGFSGADAGAA